MDTLQGLEGVEVFMDDILVYGATKEHDSCLNMVMELIQAAGLKLNRWKCSIKQGQLPFLGHLIDRSGIWLDPDKVEATLQLQPPADVQELKRNLGMADYLRRFIPNFSTVPLYELLKNKTTWTWSHTHKTPFKHVKELLTTTTVLAYCDVNKPTCCIG